MHCVASSGLTAAATSEATARRSRGSNMSAARAGGAASGGEQGREPSVCPSRQPRLHAAVRPALRRRAGAVRRFQLPLLVRGASASLRATFLARPRVFTKSTKKAERTLFSFRVGQSTLVDLSSASFHRGSHALTEEVEEERGAARASVSRKD